MTLQAREARIAFLSAVGGASVLAAIDVVASGAVLIGLLAVFPFTAALRASTLQTAIVAAYGLMLAVALGAADQIFGDERHLVNLVLVLAGGVLATVVARLRSGRERALQRLAAQHGVAEALVESATVEVARPRLLQAMAVELGFEFGAIWELDEDECLRTTEIWSTPTRDLTFFVDATRDLRFERGEGLPGRTWERGEPISTDDFAAERDFPRAPAAEAADLHGAVSFPMRTVTGTIGVVELLASDVRATDRELLDAVATLGGQVGEFFQRRRAEAQRDRLLELERLARIDAGHARDQLEVILQGVADGVTARAADGKMIFANDAALRVLGYESQQELIDDGSDQIIGRFEVFDESGEPVDPTSLPGRHALLGEQPEPMAVRFRTLATGDERWSLVKATPIFDDRGDVTMAINVFEDVTEQKRAELDQRFLAESSKALSGSLDPRETLERVARAAVPDVADWCIVDLASPDGSLERVALAHRDSSALPRAEELRRRSEPDPNARRGAPEVIRTGVAELYPEISDELLEQSARDDKHLELLREFAPRSAMVVPLTARGKALGAMTFASGTSGRRFDDRSLALAEEVGRRAGAALENARLYDERSHIARTLQRSLLPEALPEVPGVEVAARFEPTGQGNEVGGDFYDVFANDPVSGWTAVIGDVCGKGAEAAALTGLARYTLRAAAIADVPPARALELLNEAMLSQRTDGRFCTVAYAAIEPRDDGVTVRLAVGGHPLPIVLAGDGEARDAGEHGTLLGVLPELEVADHSIELAPGDALVLYTDGVTEARGEGEPLGEEGLRKVVRSCAGMAANEIAGRVEAAALAASGGRPRDDIAVVVLRVAGPAAANGGADAPSKPGTRLAEGDSGVLEASETERGPTGGPQTRGLSDLSVLAGEERLELRLSADAEAAPIARGRLTVFRDRLEPELFDDLQLLLTELVTNSVRHGRPGPAGIGVTIELTDRNVRLEVSDGGDGFSPAPLEQLEDPASGWGLYLVDRLASDWGTEAGAEGTRVWLELDREPAA